MRIVAIASSMLIFLPAFAETINVNPQNTRYICQYMSLKNGGDSADVTFYGEPPSAMVSAVVLRACLDGAIAMGGTREILATAWHSPMGSTKGEKQLTEKDGVEQLVFNPKTKRVEKFKW